MKIAVVLIATLVAVSCELDVKKYLQQYQYYNPHSFDQSSVSDAIKSFQRTFKLPQTGMADEATTKLMKTPRCGRPDYKNNAFADEKWSKTSLTYFYRNFSPDLSVADTKSLMEKAFKFWSDVTSLKFTESGTGSGDIVITFGTNRHADGRGATCGYDFDGDSGVLAHAFFPPDGRLHFDDAETYTKESQSGINFLWVATHELGHILGLEHDTVETNAVMYPYYQSYTPGFSLHASDIKRIQKQYGDGSGTGGSTVCVDKDIDCPYWRSYCYSNDYVINNCKSTCGRC